MRPSRATATGAALAIALAAAALGATVNLRLLEPQPRSKAPVVVSTSAPTGSTAASAGTDSTTSGPTSTSPPGGSPTSSTTPTTAPATPQETRAFSVGNSGTVVLSIRDGRIVIKSVRSAPGWTYEAEVQAAEVELTFRRGDTSEATLHATLREGELRVEIETEGAEGPDD